MQLPPCWRTGIGSVSCRSGSPWVFYVGGQADRSLQFTGVALNHWKSNRKMFVAAMTVAAATLGITPAVAGGSDVAAQSTVVTCLPSGSISVTDKSDSSRGVNNTPRDIAVQGHSSGSCLDARTDKSATGGHSIIGYSDVYTGDFDSSSCLAAAGTLEGTVTWHLDNDTTVTNLLTETIPVGNIFESIPGVGTLRSDGKSNGAFDGATLASTALLGNPVGHLSACATVNGVTGSPYTTTVTMLQ